MARPDANEGSAFTSRAMSALTAIAFWTIWPSFGAGPYLFATGEMAGFPGSVLGADYARTMIALKSGQTRAFSLASAEGLIGFPSFHTVMVILTVYATRAISWACVGHVAWP